jgi:aminomethyltransferase
MALRTSPLRDAHADRDASFTEFGGWEMPVEFDSIRREHAAVRERAGVFDVSHMSQVAVTGPDATALVGRLTTNDVTALSPGDAQYSTVTTTAGVMLDDVVVYRLPAADDAGAAYLVVPNAGQDGRVTDRFRARRDEWDLDASVDNETDEWAMVAVQGPDAPDLVADALGGPPGVDRFAVREASLAGVDCLLAGTGYTGEAGYEILAPWDDAAAVWAAFVDAERCPPCGLGARDTLRIEMGYLLSGQDFHPEDEPRTPFEAGIGFAVALDTEFVGRDALARVDREGVAERFVGIELRERGVARHGYEITDVTGDPVGHVTSGTMSPTRSTPVALGYVAAGHADPGGRVDVVVRGERKRAEVVTTPFVDR